MVSILSDIQSISKLTFNRDYIGKLHCTNESIQFPKRQQKHYLFVNSLLWYLLYTNRVFDETLIFTLLVLFVFGATLKTIRKSWIIQVDFEQQQQRWRRRRRRSAVMHIWWWRFAVTFGYVSIYSFHTFTLTMEYSFFPFFLLWLLMQFKAYRLLHHIMSQKMLIKAVAWTVFSSFSSLLVENFCCVTNCQQPKHLAWNFVRRVCIIVLICSPRSYCLRCFYVDVVAIALFHLSRFYALKKIVSSECYFHYLKLLLMFSINMRSA